MEKQNLMDKKSYDVDFGSIEGKKYKTKNKNLKSTINTMVILW